MRSSITPEVVSPLVPFFTPQSIGVIGASDNPNKVGYMILQNLLRDGFDGRLYGVNPKATSILGVPCFASLAECGEDVDLVILAVPAGRVIQALEDAVGVKIKGAVVVASGFREDGEDGTELERKLMEFCLRHKVRLLGPNCLGLINTENRMNLSFGPSLPAAGGLSVFSQSGAVLTGMLDCAASLQLGLAKAISVGNKADLSEVDLLKGLAEDEQTKVILGYLEDITTGDRFVRAAEQASENKPVIMLKAGTTEAGMKTAASHTGVLVDHDLAYGAAFKRSGIIRADSFAALFDYGLALSLQPLPAGNRVLIISNAGGPATLAADAVEKAGMRLASIEPRPTIRLLEQTPRGSSSTPSPVYVLGDSSVDKYLLAIRESQENPEVDAILLILAPQTMSHPEDIKQRILALPKGKKPVMLILMGRGGLDRNEHSRWTVPVYGSPEQALAALKVMYEYALWKKRPPRMVTRFRVNKRRVERIITRSQRAGRLSVGEVKGKAALAAYGFKIPQGALAATLEESLEVAEQIGFPVAMKVLSPDIVHKSDLGGVYLNVQNMEQVEDTYNLMMLKIGKRAPRAKIEGIYVERMIRKGLEVIIGMNRDPQFGPMLMFGLGGIFVEVMKDVTFHLAPVTEAEAVTMLKSTRSYAMLEGRRGQGGVDVTAIASGLQRISQLTTDFPQILELDINPFIVGDIGSEPVVADVRMMVAPPR
ncbi:acetate--CoA ligase family protein [Desulfopila sp. IMCC35008]|uniref:acetate--CoA ligase family protein n=1 Tax=Desulfopila sp. IMCC35008 TaxID=2653858 RepID=UPI0013D6863A|nr:acetate--CoA ligase [Desulfopila sp. IMCC35008]